MKDVAADPHMSANVIFDILNEPDSYGLTWGPNGNQLAGKGLGYWYHQVMKVGYGINPSALLPRPSALAGAPLTLFVRLPPPRAALTDLKRDLLGGLSPGSVPRISRA